MIQMNYLFAFMKGINEMILALLNLVLTVGITFLYRFINTNPWFLFLWIPLAIITDLAILMLFFFFIALPVVCNTKPDNPFRKCFTWLYSSLILLIAGIKVKVIGRENLPKKQGILYVANHKSLIDPIIIFNATKKASWPCAKKEVYNDMPYLRYPLKMLHTMYIDRENDRNSLKEILRGIKELKKGQGVLIFPEGGIKSRESEQMVALRSGSYKLAFKSEATIVPMAIVGNSKLGNRSVFSKRKVTVHILKPLTYDEYKDMTTHDVGFEIINRVNSIYANEEKKEVVVDE